MEKPAWGVFAQNRMRPIVRLWHAGRKLQPLTRDLAVGNRLRGYDRAVAPLARVIGVVQPLFARMLRAYSRLSRNVAAKDIR